MAKTKSILEQNPQEWVGKTFKNIVTGNTHKVIEVRKRHSRYRVLMEGPAILSQVGFDSLRFKRNWTYVEEA